MKLLYLDCFAGICARRLLGALLAVGAEKEKINLGFDTLLGDGAVQVQTADTERSGFPSVCASLVVRHGFDPAANPLPSSVQKWMDAVTCKLDCPTPTEWVTLLGVYLALEQLKVQEVVCSPLCEGGAPHPITQALSDQGAIVLRRSDCGFPLITSLGAALAATLPARFGAMPEMDITAIGYGAGAAEWDGVPNVVRAVTGEQGNLFDRMLEEALFEAAK
ncbi:MAG: DUF111 family protein [Ruminococcaceae bacterium]|nr:DUF111 family protein [Oscillospiraceae bacterium]